MKKDQTVREHIKKTLESFGVVFNEDVVCMLVSRCEKQSAEKPISFAHVIARNWALDQYRSRASAENIATQRMLNAAKTELKRESDRLRIENLKLANIELEKIIRLQHITAPTMPNALLYMRHVCIEGLSDEEVAAAFFPMTNRTQRYQWLKRARAFILPLASENLKEILMQSMWTKNKVK